MSPTRRSKDTSTYVRYRERFKFSMIAGVGIACLIGLFESLCMIFQMARYGNENVSLFPDLVQLIAFSILIYGIFGLIVSPIVCPFASVLQRLFRRKGSRGRFETMVIGVNLAFLAFFVIGIYANSSVPRSMFSFTSREFILKNMVILIASLAFGTIGSHYLAKALEKIRSRWNVRKAGISLLLGTVLVLFVLAFLSVGDGTHRAINGDKPNVILIIVDTLRPDHLSTYGYHRHTSPAIDSLARRGAKFLNAIAHNSSTAPSVSSIFTSTYVHDHRVFRNGQKLDQSVVTMAEVLQNDGYRTAGFIANGLLHNKFGFDQGFQVYDQDPEFFSNIYGTEYQKAHIYSIRHNLKIIMLIDYLLRIDSATKAATHWLRNNYDQGPFFLYIHLFQPHMPYIPSKPYRTMYTDPSYRGIINGSVKQRDAMRKGLLIPSEDDIYHEVALYDGEIALVDNSIRSILDTVDQLGIFDHTVIVFTADHGENMYEHNNPFDHSRTTYDSVVRIPLIITYPPKIPKDRVISSQVRAIDIMPTVLDLVGIQPHEKVREKVRGRALVPLIYGEKDTLDAYTEVVFPYSWLKISLKTGKWKLILNSNFKKDKLIYELYNLENDPDELNNLFTAQATPAIPLKEKLWKWMDSKEVQKFIAEAGFVSRPKLDRETKERLRALGYVD